MKAMLENIRVGELNFQTLVWGTKGEPLVMLHGFPETPHIFEGVASLLVKQGYRVFAPYLPGYGGSSSLSERAGFKDDGVVYLPQLADAIGGFLLQITDGKGPIKLVGHDWGAVCAYATAIKYPHRISHLFTLAVPPLSVFLSALIKHPEQWWRSRYMLFFQLGFGIPEKLSVYRDFSYLKKLVQQWSGGVEKSREIFQGGHLLQEMGDLKYALGYYRGLLPLRFWKASNWLKSMRLAYQPIKVPTTILVGSEDGCIPAEVYGGYQGAISAPASLEVIKGAGHFIPIDAPEYLAQLIAKK